MGATVPDMDKTPATGVPPVMSLRILVGALTGGLVVFGLVLYFVLPNGDYYFVLPNGDYLPVWVLWALGGLAVASRLLSQSQRPPGMPR